MSEDRFTRMQRRVLGVVMEEMQGWINDLLQGMLDPSKIMEFMRSMGFDPSQLPGVMSQQPGFDPYQVLGLDKSATDEEVKHRYREMMGKLHPDKAGQEMTFLATLINTAYEMIKRERGW
jgi:DnaJ-domain-containing protein 1